MFVDEYKGLRDSILRNSIHVDDEDRCLFDYKGTCPYFEEMKGSNTEINSCEQCKILLKNRGFRSDIRYRESIYCTYCKDYLECKKTRYECMKRNADCRNKNLNPNSSAGKGYITEVLVAKFLGVKTCFDITGNFNHDAFDMYEDEDWGIINVKGSKLYMSIRGQQYWGFMIKKNKKPDFFFCIGYDEYMKNVVSVLIIPNSDYVSKLVGITIIKNGHSKWNVFKESEDEVKKWDELFHTLKLKNCPVLREKEERL